MTTTEAWSAAGTAELDRLGTRDLADAVASASPELARLLVDTALGGVLGRPDLDPRTRELLAVAMLAAVGADHHQLAVHTRAALDAGASAAELVEVITQTATFAGFPRALTALQGVRREIAEAGLRLPAPRSGRAVVVEFFEALAAGDTDRVLSLLSPTVVWAVPGDPEMVPWVGERHGRAAVREFYAVLEAETERESFALGPIIAHGDLVIVRGEFAYTFPRTGGRYRGAFVLVLTVRDGLIERYEMHEDSLGLARGYEVAA